MSRAYTEEEIREDFLEHIRGLVDYWENESRAKTSKEKLDGLAFSILSMLDGCSGDMPAFEVKAIGTEEDIEYFKSLDENYYPLEGEDISGYLHELFYQQ